MVALFPKFKTPGNYDKLVCLMKKALKKDAADPDGLLYEFRPAA